MQFDYNNVPPTTSTLVRIGSFLHRGIRTIQRQIVPYAQMWQRHNAQALAGKEPLWVVLGDSMGQGIGASDYMHGWVGYLDGQLRRVSRPYRIINLSVSGAKVQDVLERQLPVMRSLGVTPALVTVTVGSNNRGRKADRRQLVELFDQLIAQLPPQAVVANILGDSHEVVAVDYRLHQAAQTGVLRLADMRAIPSWKGKTAADHYHPNDEGYKTMAAVFFAALKR
jgi:lysophospholipase L1-like esterase